MSGKFSGIACNRKDDIAQQEYTEIDITRWRYDITSRSGKKYVVSYQLAKYGYVIEEFFLGDRLVWNRSFKAGETFYPTVYDVIYNGGAMPN
jgi:hypothetical protein